MTAFLCFHLGIFMKFNTYSRMPWHHKVVREAWLGNCMTYLYCAPHPVSVVYCPLVSQLVPLIARDPAAYIMLPHVVM